MCGIVIMMYIYIIIGILTVNIQVITVKLPIIMYFKLFLYINKVYRPISKHGNLPRKQIWTAKKIGRGETNSVLRGVW